MQSDKFWVFQQCTVVFVQMQYFGDLQRNRFAATKFLKSKQYAEQCAVVFDNFSTKKIKRVKLHQVCLQMLKAVKQKYHKHITIFDKP